MKSWRLISPFHLRSKPKGIASYGSNAPTPFINTDLMSKYTTFWFLLIQLCYSIYSLFEINMIKIQFICNILLLYFRETWQCIPMSVWNSYQNVMEPIEGACPYWGCACCAESPLYKKWRWRGCKEDQRDPPWGKSVDLGCQLLETSWRIERCWDSYCMCSLYNVKRCTDNDDDHAN